MPIIKSAIKRDRQAKKRRARNLTIKTAVHKDTKAVTATVAAGKDAAKALAAAYSEIDRAVKKGYLHKNTAARRKSQLAKLVGSKTPKPAAKKPAAKKPVAKK